MELNKLSKEIYKRNKAKGFHDGKKNIGEMLCLIHAEISEALEADREGKYCEFGNKHWIINGRTLKENLVDFDDIQFITLFKQCVKDTFEDELVDVFIRVLDLAGYLNIDFEAHLNAKMRYNKLRIHKHGKKY